MPTLARMSGVVLLLLACAGGSAQVRPFVYNPVVTEDPGAGTFVHFDAAYGRATFEPLGGDNLEQAIGLQWGLSGSMSLVGKISLAVAGPSTRSAQHAELLFHLTRSGNEGVDLVLGPGYRHEYDGTSVLLGRAVVGRHFLSWQIYGSLLMEKALAQSRDGVDLLMTLGWAYRVSPSVLIGLEAVGQDLEGFWDENEAEGGAVLYVGPTLAAGIPGTPWTLSLSAGPIVRASESNRASDAVRDITVSGKNGFVIHAAVNFGL